MNGSDVEKRSRLAAGLASHTRLKRATKVQGSAFDGAIACKCPCISANTASSPLIREPEPWLEPIEPESGTSGTGGPLRDRAWRAVFGYLGVERGAPLNTLRPTLTRFEARRFYDDS
jgi:hypothetical protein